MISSNTLTDIMVLIRMSVSGVAIQVMTVLNRMNLDTAI